MLIDSTLNKKTSCKVFDSDVLKRILKNFNEKIKEEIWNYGKMRKLEKQIKNLANFNIS